MKKECKNFFVKFIPYRDEATLYYLQNKLIRFSTVYDFNDFNELHYIGFREKDTPSEVEKEIESRFTDASAREVLYKQVYDSGIYYRNALKCFKHRLDDFPYRGLKAFCQTDYLVINEYLAFSSVGIFCMSSLKVFCDDSAQLMFAHYGDNLKGLALIYKVEKLSSEVCYYSYQENEKCQKCNRPIERTLLECKAEEKHDSEGSLMEWIEGNFKQENMGDFLQKSKKWEYEKEYRVFCTPEIKKTTEVGMELKAILYTTRFKKEHVEHLKEINRSVYKEELKIQEIRPSYTYYRFDISDDRRSHPVVEWLTQHEFKAS